jgi:HSP20 family molecular chaperone IbpA
MSAGKPRTPPEFERAQRRMESLVRHFLRGPYLSAASAPECGWAPATDVYETAGHYVILMEIAGVDRDRLEVTLDGSLLRVRGERCEPAPAEAKALLHLMEIDYGPFERVIELPEPPPEAERVEAHYENGFLRLRVPRRSGGRVVKVETEPKRG